MILGEGIPSIRSLDLSQASNYDLVLWDSYPQLCHESMLIRLTAIDNWVARTLGRNDDRVR